MTLNTNQSFLIEISPLEDSFIHTLCKTFTDIYGVPIFPFSNEKDIFVRITHYSSDSAIYISIFSILCDPTRYVEYENAVNKLGIFKGDWCIVMGSIGEPAIVFQDEVAKNCLLRLIKLYNLDRHGIVYYQGG